MKREIPLLLVGFFGFFYVLDLFITWQPWKTVGTELQVWANVLIAFAYVLGAGNVLRIHGTRFLRKQRDWGYSMVTVIAMLLMIIFGVTHKTWFTGGGHTGGSIFDWMYVSMYSPMQATMFSLLAFYISSAAFRAFRVRSLQASLLAITATVVMMGGVPLGTQLWDGFPRTLAILRGPFVVDAVR